MPRLLTNQDYGKQIQQDNLLQVIESNYQYLYDAEQTAQAEMIGYLVQRYITSDVFTDTTVFSNSATYQAKNLIYLDATAFSAATVYLTGQLVLQSGRVYSSIAGSSAHAFNASEWTDLGAQYSYFHVKLPFTEYSRETTYSIGDQTWYKNKTYTALVASKGILPTESTAFWGTGTDYTVSGVLPTDTTKWTAGDNRNQQIITYLIDITLYHLHSRINPRNVPDLRMRRYDGNQQVGMPTSSAIGWLKAVASGDITADLPNIDPQQGVSITWGVSEGLDSSGVYNYSRNQLW